MPKILVILIKDDFDLYYGRYPEAARHVEELAADIAKNGLKNPIEIHKIGEKLYEVVSGVHRLRAVKKLGWVEVECNVIDHGPQASPFPRERYHHEPRQEPNPPKGTKVLEGEGVIH